MDSVRDLERRPIKPRSLTKVLQGQSTRAVIGGPCFNPRFEN